MKVAIILSILTISTLALGQEVDCKTNPTHPSCTTTTIEETNTPTETTIEVNELDTTETLNFPTLDSSPSDSDESSVEPDTSSNQTEEESF